MDILNNNIYEINSLLSIFIKKLNNENTLISNNVLEYNSIVDNFTIQNNNKLINRIEVILESICNHNWLYDYVDDLYGNTIRIKYCEYCELTKK
jgi:hypothetical protein